MLESAFQTHIAPGFQAKLEGFDPQLLDSDRVSICGVWSDLTISFLSPGWLAFAEANGGEPAVSQKWGIGAELLSGIDRSLRSFYQAGFQRCLAEERPWQHDYECSSADVYRWLEMIAYPLPEASGLLIVHSVRLERPHDSADDSAAAQPEAYLDQHGLMHQCSYCRRVQRADRPEVWDWVREWVEQPWGSTSHGICESCYGFYAPRVTGELKLPLPRTDAEGENLL